MFQAFRTQESTYRRYWARAFAGWPRFTDAEPGAAHHALAALERTGSVARLVTQNVDGLHQRAGHRDAIDLHGRLDVVVCLTCRDRNIARVCPGRDGCGQLAVECRRPPPRRDGDADIDPAAIPVVRTTAVRTLRSASSNQTSSSSARTFQPLRYVKMPATL